MNSPNFSSDKEISLQTYHPSLIESYREKFLLGHDQKLAEGSFLQKFNPTAFSHLHPYSKNLNLNALHDSLNNRAQLVADDPQQQTMRVKNLYSLTNEAVVKSQSDAQSTIFKTQNIPNNLASNDKNNNKNSESGREKIETQYENPSALNTTDKSHVIHLNSKSGVSLKCAYCEAREDFKTR